jgi:hypothetical protein
MAETWGYGLVYIFLDYCMVFFLDGWLGGWDWTFLIAWRDVHLCFVWLLVAPVTDEWDGNWIRTGRSFGRGYSFLDGDVLSR